MGNMPVRSGSVSSQTSERSDKFPVGSPFLNGELANKAVASGCSASAILSFSTISAGEPKSRLTCTVAVRYIISSPRVPRVGI